MGSTWNEKWKQASLARWDPTSLEIVRGMLELAKVGSQDIVYDLGCGDARILFVAVKEFGAQKAVGYEIRQDLCDDSWEEIQRQNLQERISVIKGNLLDADISEASVITLYLFPTANEILRPKLEKETKLGARVISHAYRIETWQIAETAVCSGGTLYLYIIPQAFQSSSSNIAKSVEQRK
jgi:tRNA1(Val) A37 N6-methylase TrmN6